MQLATIFAIPSVVVFPSPSQTDYHRCFLLWEKWFCHYIHCKPNEWAFFSLVEFWWFLILRKFCTHRACHPLMPPLPMHHGNRHETHSFASCTASLRYITGKCLANRPNYSLSSLPTESCNSNALRISIINFFFISSLHFPSVCW